MFGIQPGRSKHRTERFTLRRSTKQKIHARHGIQFLLSFAFTNFVGFVTKYWGTGYYEEVVTGNHQIDEVIPNSRLAQKKTFREL